MALLEIPVKKDSPDQKFTISLDKVVYTIRIKLNARTGRFFMDIMTEDETILAAGICLVTGYDFMDEYNIAGLPAGDLFILDTLEQDQEPTADNFGESVVLMYNEATA